MINYLPPPVYYLLKMFFIIFKRWLLWGLSLTRGTTSFPEITFGGLYEKTLQRLLVVDGADGHVEGTHIVEVVISPFYFCQYAPCGYYTRINVIASHVTLCPANS